MWVQAERPWRAVAEDFITLTLGRKESQNTKIAIQSVSAAQAANNVLLTRPHPAAAAAAAAHRSGKSLPTFIHCSKLRLQLL